MHNFHQAGPVHVLEFLCKAIRNVTRSTFAAELHAACDAADLGILLQLMLHEVTHGPVSSTVSRDLRTYGGHNVPMFLAIDAMSVFAAVTATYIKAPAEKSLLSHVQFIREMLDSGVLKALEWWDTRDMTADGLTKGAVDRICLMNLMQGMLTIAHENKTWSSKLALVKNSRLADLNTPLPQSVPEPSQFSTEPTIPSAVEELGEDLGKLSL